MVSPDARLSSRQSTNFAAIVPSDVVLLTERRRIRENARDRNTT
jgi:hypothetical protein